MSSIVTTRSPRRGRLSNCPLALRRGDDGAEPAGVLRMPFIVVLQKAVVVGDGNGHAVHPTARAAPRYNGVPMEASCTS